MSDYVLLDREEYDGLLRRLDYTSDYEHQKRLADMAVKMGEDSFAYQGKFIRSALEALSK